MVIDAACGRMEGIETEGMKQFLGIPYAAPPIGPLRFRPPVSYAPWEGTRSCTKLGHAAPQLYVPGLTCLKEEETLDEDCLYLNVTTPDTTGRLPVLFWIHGGAFQKGSATLGIEPIAFAREGMVVVNINYRLGVLGFLDVSAYLGDEYAQSGNNGLLDIIMALRWVQENISAFGGDPQNVTIMGQSAGSKIVSTLTVMPSAKGLFQKAVMCSGTLQCIRSRRTAHRVAELFMQDAGITKEHAEELLTMPWEKILKAQTNLFAGLNLHTVGPLFDDIELCGRDALALIGKNMAPKIKLLLGTNRDEMNLYWEVYQVHDMDEALAVRLFGNRAPIILREYEKIPHDDDFRMNFVHFLTEYIYHAGALRMAETAAAAGHEVYLYRLDWDRQSLGACHASESQFLMGQCGVIKDMDTSPEHEMLANKMHHAFVNFIKTGTPEAEELPTWEAFTAEGREQMTFDASCRMERAPIAEIVADMPYEVFELE